MKLYARLYASLLEYCDRNRSGRGFAYTAAMLALGLGLALNLLSVMNLLWTLRVLHDPYGGGGHLRPEHYVFALLCGGFVANSILARIRFTADRRDVGAASESTSALAPGPAYVVLSVVLFAATLTLGLLCHG